MKVVLDTNVFVSSFFGGNPRKIIDLWAQGELTLCVTAAVVDEYFEVLKRLGLEREPEYKELMDLFARGRNILFAAQTPKLKIVKADPADDKFIECAVAHWAEAIVSGDKDLLKIGKYIGVRILSPAEFLKSK